MIFGPNLLKVSFSREETNKDKKGNNKKKRISVTIDTEDIIAIFGGLVAVMFAVAMIAKWVPINELTVGIAGLSGVGAVVAKVIKA